jgi:hypothetical protein
MAWMDPDQTGYWPSVDDRIAGGRDDPWAVDQPTPDGWDGSVWDEYAAMTRAAGQSPDPDWPHDDLSYAPTHPCGCPDQGWPCMVHGGR